MGKWVHVGKFGTNNTFEKHLVIWTRRDNSTVLQRRIYGWAFHVMEEVSQRLAWFWPSLSLKSEQGAFCYICNSMHVVFFRQIMWRFVLWNNVWGKETFSWYGLATLSPNGWHFHNRSVVVSWRAEGQNVTFLKEWQKCAAFAARNYRTGFISSNSPLLECAFSHLTHA